MTEDVTSRARPVALVMGGPSAEHDVSLVSGRAIAAGLRERGRDVTGWVIDLGGAWWRLPDDALDPSIAAVRYDDPAALDGDGPCTAGEALASMAAAPAPPVVFIALHGPFGEDGTVQALCEAAGLPYTGSGVAASAVGMDKPLFKRLVGALGMPITPWEPVAAATFRTDRGGTLERLARFADSLPDGRLIVKPARLGSSVGISIVHRPGDPATLGSALDAAFRFGDVALVEAYLPAPRELEVSVVGNGAEDVAVYGPGEIFPGHEFYDYEAKYRSASSRTTARPELSERVRAEIRRLARDAYLAIGAAGFARVDFLLHDRVYISEINTVPGFTPISLFPVLCAEGGFDFAGISERIVELALERDRHRPVTRLTRADLP